MYTLDSERAVVQQEVMEKSGTQKKVSTSSRLHVDVRASFDELVKRVNSKSTGRVNIGAFWGAAVAALLKLTPDEQDDLIFAAGKLDDPDLANDPRLKQMRAILRKGPQSR